MRKREIAAAKAFGVYEKCKALEADLLKIEGVEPDCFTNGVSIDASCLYSDIKQIIIVPKYNIDVTLDNYFETRREMLNRILETCRQYGLTPSGDTLEDYGAHFYIVRNCDWDIYPKNHCIDEETMDLYCCNCKNDKSEKCQTCCGRGLPTNYYPITLKEETK